MKELKSWEVDSVLFHEAINNLFAPCSSYFDIRKEVRKKMAIDYKGVWEEFREEYGQNYIQVKVGSPKSTSTLDNLMNTWIRNVILDRERLMEEYVKEKIYTEIDGGQKRCHIVNVVERHRNGRNSLLVKMKVGKQDFEYWVYKKEKGGK